MAILFAAIDKMVGGRVVGHEPERILIASIRDFTPLQDTDNGYTEIVNFGIEMQPIIGLRFLLIVV